KGLLLTLGLMAMGTLTIALVPGYATLGVAAPILILLGRLFVTFFLFCFFCFLLFKYTPPAL
ncbi:hypothetical protein HZD82_26610, partial [Pantoea agglomerans]|uniref:hypothetical protein n=1 Tax=Enterobacter agglomerans TaxID=549 RepID=UPI001A8DF3C7